MAVYRDVIEAVLEWMPTEEAMEQEIQAVNDRLAALQTLRRMAQGALTEEGIDSALLYVKKLEKIADLLAEAKDEKGIPDINALHMAMDLAKDLKEEEQ